MTWLRNGLIGAILLVVFLLFIRWTEFQEQQIAARAPSQETVSIVQETPSSPLIRTSEPTSEDLPATPAVEPEAEVLDFAKSTNAALISVKTDTLDILIDPLGGDIIKAALPKYPAKINQEEPFLLLNRSSSHTYIAQSDLYGPKAPHNRESGRSIYSSVANTYQLNDGDDSIVVDLTLTLADVFIIKRFSFSRGSYLIKVEYLIENQSNEPWKAVMYGRIKRDAWVPPSETGFGMQPYVGAAITTPESNYKKIDFEDLNEEKFETHHQGGWVAMIQHYFVSAWIPNPEEDNKYTLQRADDRKHYLLEYSSPWQTLAPGENKTLSAGFYVGPKTIKNLEKVAPFLDLTIDFGWLWFIAKPLFLALDFIQDFVGNWGIAIILLTCMVKIIFFYPSALSYRSMAKMRKVMPQMQELKERYGDDRQRLGMETMKLYKKEGVNPLGGCLPMLLQMPVFIALYWALMESVELRQSPFFLWIVDLSVKDPYFVLPLIFGASMYFQQKLNPAPPDPMSAKIMQMMPIFFTFLFMMFPAGLVLYWVTNNLLSIAQQYVITKQIENTST